MYTHPDRSSSQEVGEEAFLRAQILGTARSLLLLAIPVLMAYLAFELTPGRGVSTDGRAKVSLFAGMIRTTISPDLEMLLFVVLMAGLGGFVAAVSNRAAVQHLSPLERLGAYLIQTTAAAFLGTIFYVLIRAGVLTGASVRDINPLGMAVLSLGVGFSAPVVMKRLRSAVVELYGEEPEVVRAIERLEQRFESALSEPTLDNFDGTVWVRVSDKVGSELPRESSEQDQTCFAAVPGQDCGLEVRFVSGQNHGESSGGLHEELRIRRGNTVERVTFDVTLDSRTVEIVEDRLSCTFDPNSSPPPLKFYFVAPEKQGDHDLFVEISQKNRLLQSVTVRLRVGGTAT